MRWWRPLCIAFFLLLALAASLYTYRTPLMGWYLKGYAEKCYRCTVDYKNIISTDERGILFSDVVIKPTKGALKGLTITCDEMLFNYHFFWSERRLIGKLHLDHPKIGLQSPETPSFSEPARWESKLKSKRRAFFFIHPEIVIDADKGEIALGEEGEILRWEGQAHLGTQIKTHFIFSEDDKGKGSLSLTENKDEIALHFDLQHFSLPLAMEFLKRKNHEFRFWSALEGKIEGHLDLILGRQAPLLKQGNFKIEDAELLSPLGNLKLQSLSLESSGHKTFSDGTVILHRGEWEKNGWKVKDIHGEIQVVKGEILPSSRWQGKLGTLDLALLFEGKIEHPHAHFHAEGVLSQLPGDLLSKYPLPPLWEKEKVSIAIEIGAEGSWKGLLHVGEDRLSVEGTVEGEYNPIKGPSVKVKECRFLSTPLEIKKYALWLRHDLKNPFSQVAWNGKITLKGECFGKELHLEPLISGLSLRWEKLALNVPKINQGKLTYDLSTRELKGSFPLRDITFIDDQHHFTSDEGRGNLLFYRDKISLQDLELFSEGLFTISQITLSMEDHRSAELVVNNHTLGGTLSQLKNVVSRYDPNLFFYSIPIEANLSYLGEGLVARWRYHPENHHWEIIDAHFEGEVSEGTTRTQYGKMGLHDLSLRVDYNYQANQLILQDIQGLLLIGRGEGVEQYDLAGDKIHFTDFRGHACSFDCWIGLRNRDILRLVGKTEEKIDGDGNKKIFVAFDSDLSHLGVVHPHQAHLILRDWNHPERWDLQFSFQLATALGDFQRFIRSGFLGMSPGVTQAIDQIRRAHGSFDVRLSWAPDQFLYRLSGYDIVVDNVEFEKMALKGARRDHMWNIDELQLDHLLVSAKLFNEGKNLRIPHFDVKMGTTGFMGSDALYYSDDDHLEARIHQFQLDLSHLEEFDLLQPFAKRYKPQGKLSGAGSLRIEFLKDCWYRAEALLNAKLLGLKIQHVPFADVEEVTVGYLSDKGVTFQAFETSMQRKTESREAVTLNIDRGGYDFLAEELWLRGLKFNVPYHHLPWVGETLQKALPDAFPPYLARMLIGCKREEALKGAFDVQMREKYCSATLTLDQGHYYIAGHLHYLRHATFSFNPNEVRLNTLYDLYGRPLLLSFQTPNFDFPYGTLSVSSQFQQESPLVIDWNREASGGVWMQHAQGKVAGATFDLKGIPSHLLDDTWTLQGSVAFDVAETATYFPGTIWSAAVMKGRLGHGYQLQGKWKIPKDQWLNFSFLGSLLGKKFQMMGYEIDHLQSKVEINKDNIIIHEAQIADTAGRMKLSQIHAQTNPQGKWEMRVSKMSVDDFKPKLLRHIGSPVKKNRDSFTFEFLEMTDLKGEIENPSTWQATGSFSFHHPQHKDSHGKSFLTIPSDTLKKIGIDLAAITPVSGEIAFEIDQEQLFFTRFQDVYSQNKLVKFQLSKNSFSSLGFDGRMNLHLSLKPYHVMFKFAEFFTLGIQGDVNNPTFNIEK